MILVKLLVNVELPKVPKRGVMRVMSRGLEDHEDLLKDQDWILCYDHGACKWVYRVRPEARRRVLGLGGYMGRIFRSNRGHKGFKVMDPRVLGFDIL